MVIGNYFGVHSTPGPRRIWGILAQTFQFLSRNNLPWACYVYKSLKNRQSEAETYWYSYIIYQTYSSLIILSGVTRNPFINSSNNVQLQFAISFFFVPSPTIAYALSSAIVLFLILTIIFFSYLILKIVNTIRPDHYPWIRPDRRTLT